MHWIGAGLFNCFVYIFFIYTCAITWLNLLLFFFFSGLSKCWWWWLKYIILNRLYRMRTTFSLMDNSTYCRKNVAFSLYSMQKIRSNDPVLFNLKNLVFLKMNRRKKRQLKSHTLMKCTNRNHICRFQVTNNIVINNSFFRCWSEENKSPCSSNKYIHFRVTKCVKEICFDLYRTQNLTQNENGKKEMKKIF